MHCRQSSGMFDGYDFYTVSEYMLDNLTSICYYRFRKEFLGKTQVALHYHLHKYIVADAQF